jgi:hypothetical protein
MMRFRLKAGGHIQADPNWERKPSDPPDARAPSVSYKAGDVVESETDLVEKFGATKFERLPGEVRRKYPSTYIEDTKFGKRLPGDPTPEIEAKSPSLGGSGQVAQGHQVATPSTADEGRPSAGMSPKLLKEYGGLKESEDVREKALNEGGELGVVDNPTPEEAPEEEVPEGEEEGDEETSKGGYTRSQLEGMKVADLKEVAKTEKVEVPEGAKKADIVEAILNG